MKFLKLADGRAKGRVVLHLGIRIYINLEVPQLYNLKDFNFFHGPAKQIWRM